MEPLTPELALVDPDLARLARDRLPTPGETPSSPERALSPGKDLGETSGRESRVPGFDDSRRLEKPLSASSGLAAEGRPGRESANEKHDLRAPSRSHRRGRVFLGALGVVLAAIAVYALAPDSTVREEASNRAAKSATTRIDRHVKPQESTKATRAAGAGAPTVPRHSGVLGATVPTRASSKRPRPVSIRVFIWPVVPDATSYRFEFFRRGLELFTARSSRARLELPRHWVYRGRTYQPVAGKTYIWKVSPAFGPRSRLRYGDPIVRSTWVAPR